MGLLSATKKAYIRIDRAVGGRLPGGVPSKPSKPEPKVEVKVSKKTIVSSKTPSGKTVTYTIEPTKENKKKFFNVTINKKGHILPTEKYTSTPDAEDIIKDPGKYGYEKAKVVESNNKRTIVLEPKEKPEQKVETKKVEVVKYTMGDKTYLAVSDNKFYQSLTDKKIKIGDKEYIVTRRLPIGGGGERGYIEIQKTRMVGEQYPTLTIEQEKTQFELEKERIKAFLLDPKESTLKKFGLIWSSGLFSKEDPAKVRSATHVVRAMLGKEDSETAMENIAELIATATYGWGTSDKWGKAKIVLTSPMAMAGYVLLGSYGLGAGIGAISRVAPRTGKVLEYGTTGYFLGRAAYDIGKEMYHKRWENVAVKSTMFALYTPLAVSGYRYVYKKGYAYAESKYLSNIYMKSQAEIKEFIDTGDIRYFKGTYEAQFKPHLEAKTPATIKGEFSGYTLRSGKVIEGIKLGKKSYGFEVQKEETFTVFAGKAKYGARSYDIEAYTKTTPLTERISTYKGVGRYGKQIKTYEGLSEDYLIKEYSTQLGKDIKADIRETYFKGVSGTEGSRSLLWEIGRIKDIIGIEQEPYEFTGRPKPGRDDLIRFLTSKDVTTTKDVTTVDTGKGTKQIKSVDLGSSSVIRLDTKTIAELFRPTPQNKAIVTYEYVAYPKEMSIQKNNIISSIFSPSRIRETTRLNLIVEQSQMQRVREKTVSLLSSLTRVSEKAGTRIIPRGGEISIIKPLEITAQLTELKLRQRYRIGYRYKLEETTKVRPRPTLGFGFGFFLPRPSVPSGGLSPIRVRRVFRPKKIKFFGTKSLLSDYLSVMKSQLLFGKATHIRPTPKAMKLAERTLFLNVPTLELISRRKRGGRYAKKRRKKKR